MSAGEKIYAARRARHWSREKLAEQAGVPVSTVTGWEEGKRAPKVDQAVRLSDLLGLTLRELLSDEPPTGFMLLDPYPDPYDLYTFVKEKAQAARMFQTLEALSLMSLRRREGPKRKSRYGFDAPYEVQPLTMACHALAMGLADDDVLAACLMHDVLDDTEMTLETFPEEIGELVRETVRLVSYSTYLSAEDAEDPEKKDAVEFVCYRSVSKHPLASLVKCLDRCCTLATMADGFELEKMVKYIRQTEVFVMPLLDVVERVLDWKNAAWLLRYRMATTIEVYKRLL